MLFVAQDSSKIAWCRITNQGTPYQSNNILLFVMRAFCMPQLYVMMSFLVLVEFVSCSFPSTSFPDHLLTFDLHQVLEVYMKFPNAPFLRNQYFLFKLSMVLCTLLHHTPKIGKRLHKPGSKELLFRVLYL